MIYFTSKWLAEFAYRIDLEWWFFVGSGCLALLIALFYRSTSNGESIARKPDSVFETRVNSLLCILFVVKCNHLEQNKFDASRKALDYHKVV